MFTTLVFCSVHINNQYRDSSCFSASIHNMANYFTPVKTQHLKVLHLLYDKSSLCLIHIPPHRDACAWSRHVFTSVTLLLTWYFRNTSGEFLHNCSHWRLDFGSLYTRLFHFTRSLGSYVFIRGLRERLCVSLKSQTSLKYKLTINASQNKTPWISHQIKCVFSHPLLSQL